MTAPVTKEQSDKLYPKIEKLMVAHAVERARTLKAIRKAPVPQPKESTVKAVGKMHRWDVVDRPLDEYIIKRFAETGILKPAGVKFEWKVVIDIPEKEWKIIQTSSRLSKFGASTEAIYQRALAAMNNRIVKAEGDVLQIQGEPGWTADEINAGVKKRCDQLFEELQKISDESAGAAVKRCDTMLAAIHKENKELNTWYAKSFLKMTGAVGGIVSSTATIVGTGGAASPAAAFTLSKSVLVLSQEIVRLAMGADTRYAAIQVELRKVQQLIIKAGDKSSAASDIKELAFSVLGTASGVEVPSVKSLQKHVKDYRQDITKIHQKLDEQGAKLNKLLDEQTKFANQLRAMNAPKAKETKILDAFDKVIKSTMEKVDECSEINGRSDLAEERYIDLLEITESMSKGIRGWVKIVDPLLGAALEVGMLFTGGPKVEMPEIMEHAKLGLEIVKEGEVAIAEEIETIVEIKELKRK